MKEFTMLKKIFNCKIKIKIKTATTGLKNELKYSQYLNTCIAEPELEVLITLKNNSVQD